MHPALPGQPMGCMLPGACKVMFVAPLLQQASVFVAWRHLLLFPAACLQGHGARAPALLRNNSPGHALPPLLWYVRTVPGGSSAPWACLQLSALDRTLSHACTVYLCSRLLDRGAADDDTTPQAFGTHHAARSLTATTRSVFHTCTCADLEFATADNPDLDGASATDALLALVGDRLLEQFQLEVQPGWVLELDSSTEAKFSRHVVIR